MTRHTHRKIDSCSRHISKAIKKPDDVFAFKSLAEAVTRNASCELVSSAKPVGLASHKLRPAVNPALRA